MKYSYSLDERAQEEYEDSVRWYKEKSPSTAERFVEAVDDVIRKICEEPTRGRNKYRQFFEFNVPKFPFAIIYFIDDNLKEVLIFSVFHKKRNPDKKYKDG